VSSLQEDHMARTPAPLDSGVGLMPAALAGQWKMILPPMKQRRLLVLPFLATLCCTAAAWAQPSTTNLFSVPGKYCCDMPSVGAVCVVFKADGSYEATGRLSHKDGTSQGTWKQRGTHIILTPKEETGCLVGYLTRFGVEEHGEKWLTWLPKSPQDFARSGGAIVYPRYTKSEAKAP
jgi:hypothetical protein